MANFLRSNGALPFIMFGTLPQGQGNRADRIPLWIWVLVIFLVILIGIIWTLREEEEQKQAQAVPPQPDTLPEPVVKVVEPTPVAEITTSEVAEESVVEQPEPVETAPPKPDDLKKIKGIGPKISGELNDRGIFTFEQLANIDVDYLNQLMDELDWHINDPVTWPEQARRLAEEKARKGR